MGSRQAEQAERDGLNELDERYDVVVVGGGAAGLSGALALARARRSVLVVDAGEPRNAPAGHLHNYLSRDGVSPSELLEAGRAEVRGYGSRVEPGEVTELERTEDGFAVRLGDGRSTRARRLLVTTGLRDQLPDLPGLAERWGEDVLHCPYCHGWEARDRRIGVLATGPLSWHQAEMWRQWSETVLVIRHGAPAPGQEQAERLAARGVEIVDGPVEALELKDEALAGVRLADGELLELDVLVVAPAFAARAEPLRQLGLEPAALEWQGQVLGHRVPSEQNGASAVPGVWLAGNVTDLQGQLITAAADGLRAAVAINMDLIEEETREAVDAFRQRLGTMFEREAWEERYRSKSMLWSGEPNPQLVAEVAELPPGRALDVGSGEGADAIWLAGRGWQVTAVDISAVALERAAAHAEAAGPELAARIEWTQADLREQPPTAGGYELVTAQFMHLPGEARRALYARLAEAVAPGGLLLIVGHHPSDLRLHAGPRLVPGALFTADELAASLDPDAFEVLTAEHRPRPKVTEDGGTITLHDVVVVARRR